MCCVKLGHKSSGCRRLSRDQALSTSAKTGDVFGYQVKLCIQNRAMHCSLCPQRADDCLLTKHYPAVILRMRHTVFKQRSFKAWVHQRGLPVVASSAARPGVMPVCAMCRSRQVYGRDGPALAAQYSGWAPSPGPAGAGGQPALSTLVGSRKHSCSRAALCGTSPAPQSRMDGLQCVAPSLVLYTQ